MARYGDLYGDLEDSSTSFDQCLRVNAAGYYFWSRFCQQNRGWVCHTARAFFPATVQSLKQ